MKRKRLRMAAVVLLLGLIAAVPASTQVLRSTGETDEGPNLRLLILVNRMELTAEQMREIHGLLEEILAEREANELRVEELEAELIAFTGSAEELDELLATFRAGTEERIDAARDRVEEALGRLKEILTAKQGEILDEIFPGFLGGCGTPNRAARDVEGIQERLEERLADRPELLERLRDRAGARSDLAGAVRGGRAAPTGRSLVQDFRSRSQGAGPLTLLQLGRARRVGADWIEQLAEVLERKLEAIE